MLILRSFGLSPTDPLVGHFSFNGGLFENGVGETDPSTGIFSDKRGSITPVTGLFGGKRMKEAFDSLVPFLPLECPSPLLSISIPTLFFRF